MSENHIPRDKKGNPLQAGQLVKIEFYDVFGHLSGVKIARIVAAGKQQSIVEDRNGRLSDEPVDNSQIEVKTNV